MLTGTHYSDNRWELDHARICVVIDKKSVLHNFRAMRDNLPAGTKVCAVVKTDAYGMGAVHIAGLLDGEKEIWGYAVATADEAIELRSAGITKPLLILGYTFPTDYDNMITKGVRLAVFRYDTLSELSARVAHLRAKGQDVTAYVHVAVDSGMSRIGVTPDDNGLMFIKEVLKTEGVELEGIFTHFARADEADLTDARERYLRFSHFVNEAEKLPGMDRLKGSLIRHCANSASIIDMPEAHMDMVRAGVSLYGMSPSDEVSRDRVKILPVMSLISHISLIKTVPEGTPVSYGGTFVTDRVTRIATIPTGYGDGYPRSLSNKGKVLIRGRYAPILGRICMDQFMVDVTHIPDAAEGDRVTLIGKDGDKEITIEALGEESGRFNYELACDINHRVPRAYI